MRSTPVHLRCTALTHSEYSELTLPLLETQGVSLKPTLYDTNVNEQLLSERYMFQGCKELNSVRFQIPLGRKSTAVHYYS